MKSALIREAKSREADYSNTRPSRRSTDNNTGWFITVIMNQRSIVAHAISEEGSEDRKLFENALILEADFSLGRNPLNKIHMTTATTGLANKRSFENAYTSGWNDGVDGVHPGHTPYMNHRNWSSVSSSIMASPSWMTSKNFPVGVNAWPIGELYYNTRYVYAANEFTPQQTMRGKTALYGYLYAIRPGVERPPVVKRANKPVSSIPSGWQVNENTEITLVSHTTNSKVYYTIDGSTPSADNGLEYTEPIAIMEHIIIRAITIRGDMLDSEISVFEYHIFDHEAQVETPEASIPSDSKIVEGSMVTLSSETTGATIYYTTDGSTPSIDNGLKYTQPIVITANVTIRAIAVRAGMLDSEVAVFEYMVQVIAPTASVPSGSTVNRNTTVRLSTGTTGAAIHYTVNGVTFPPGNSFNTRITITENTVIQAIAKREGFWDSEKAVFEYFVSQSSTLTSTSSSSTVAVYPNPVQTGGTLYMETGKAGIPIEIYSQSGVSVKQLISTGKVTAITLDIQAGNYIVRIVAKETKIILK
jgi:hypothetical protein